MKKPFQRICIYPKDVQKITGKSERYSRELLKKIKKHYAKQPHHYLTAKELGEYIGIPEETIFTFLND